MHEGIYAEGTHRISMWWNRSNNIYITVCIYLVVDIMADADVGCPSSTFTHDRGLERYGEDHNAGETRPMRDPIEMTENQNTGLVGASQGGSLESFV